MRSVPVRTTFLAAAESESAGLKTMHVEVVYALPDVQHRLHLELPEGSTVAAALDAVRRIPPFREMDLTAQTVGIFGRIVGPDELLGPEDRVEIYRPLKMDPKEARRRRAG